MKIIVLSLSLLLLVSPAAGSASGETVYSTQIVPLLSTDDRKLGDYPAAIKTRNEYISNFFSLAVRSSAAQNGMTEPTNFFTNFPEIEWGMSVEKAKEAIEKTGSRAARPVETRLNWVGTFDGREGLGVFLFAEDGGLEAVLVRALYSEKGKGLYESWSKKMTNKHGEAKEEVLSDDVIARRWNFKNGFFVEIRLLKGEGENRYMADIHWERIRPTK